ncbi:MAG: HesB/IscA family protein [Gammaproteobacteria bacterium]
MPIQLTETAANRVKTLLDKRGHGLGLRLGTRKSGCSGFAYTVDYADEIRADDAVFESHGVKVVVDAANLPVLEGMELDYVRNNALNEGFEFRNPNVKDTCGCGESFNV